MIATAADTRPRRIAALSLAAIALTCFAAVYHAGVLPQPDEFGRQKDAATFQGEESCKSRSGPIHSFINSAVDKVVARVPDRRASPHPQRLPLQARIHTSRAVAAAPPPRHTVRNASLTPTRCPAPRYPTCPWRQTSTSGPSRSPSPSSRSRRCRSSRSTTTRAAACGTGSR